MKGTEGPLGTLSVQQVPPFVQQKKFSPLPDSGCCFGVAETHIEGGDPVSLSGQETKSREALGDTSWECWVVVTSFWKGKGKTPVLSSFPGHSFHGPPPFPEAPHSQMQTGGSGPQGSGFQPKGVASV